MDKGVVFSCVYQYNFKNCFPTNWLQLHRAHIKQANKLSVSWMLCVNMGQEHIPGVLYFLMLKEKVCDLAAWVSSYWKGASQTATDSIELGNEDRKWNGVLFLSWTGRIESSVNYFRSYRRTARMQPCFDGLFDVLRKKCHSDPAYVLTGGTALHS